MTNLREKIEGILDEHDKRTLATHGLAIEQILSAIREELPKEYAETKLLLKALFDPRIQYSYKRGFNDCLSQLKQILGVTND